MRLCNGFSDNLFPLIFQGHLGNCCDFFCATAFRPRKLKFLADYSVKDVGNTWANLFNICLLKLSITKWIFFSTVRVIRYGTRCDVSFPVPSSIKCTQISFSLPRHLTFSLLRFSCLIFEPSICTFISFFYFSFL
jgi:hypothetical protein